MGRVIPVQMARASIEDVEKLMRFMQLLEHIDECGDRFKNRTVLRRVYGWWSRLGIRGRWCRVIWGYRTLMDNCCDPNSQVLEWRPEFLRMAKAAATKDTEYPDWQQAAEQIERMRAWWDATEHLRAAEQQGEVA